MESVWSWFTNELCSSPELVKRPIVLLLQDSESLLPCERPLEPVDSSHEVVLRLVENLLSLEDVENSLLHGDDIFRVYKLLQLLN